MPVFDFSSASEEKEAFVCTYTAFTSDSSEKTPDDPILVLDNQQKQWSHHSTGVFCNQSQWTAFEFKEEDEAEAVRSRTALPPLSEDKVTDPLVLRIVAYLKENYRSKITLADLQEQFHYSERYINQKFQKELGTTVIDYLNRCRIQNALELIRKGKLPISQIGWECGIGEYKYFNHVFKKYIGCSVREYQSTLK